MNTTIKTSPFEISEMLDSEEMIAEYLRVAAEDPNPDVFLTALGDVAKARGMSQLAKSTGLGRESLYKAFAPGGNPTYNTIHRIMSSLGVRISAQPISG